MYSYAVCVGNCIGWYNGTKQYTRLPSSSKKEPSFNPAGYSTYTYPYIRMYVHIQYHIYIYAHTYCIYTLLYTIILIFDDISPFADGLHQIFGPKPLKHGHIDLRIRTHIFSGRPWWSWCGFHLGICLDSSHHGFMASTCRFFTGVVRVYCVTN